MTTNTTTKLKKGFAENRKPVKARVFSKLKENSCFKWERVSINTCSDEGKDFVSISSSGSSIDGFNSVEMFFELENVPSLIATLQTALNTANQNNVENQIKWELNEQNNKAW